MIQRTRRLGKAIELQWHRQNIVKPYSWELQSREVQNSVLLVIDAWDRWLSKFQHTDSLCFRCPWLCKVDNDWCKGSRSPISNDPCLHIDNVNNIIHHGLFLVKKWTSTSSNGLWCEVYDLFMCFFLLHYAVWILHWYWGKILFLICFHDSLLDSMQNLLYDVVPTITHHVMLWDPLLKVATYTYLEFFYSSQKETPILWIYKHSI